MSRALLPAVPPSIPHTLYPRWRSWGHALLDGARIVWDGMWTPGPTSMSRIGAVVHTEAVAHPKAFPAFLDLCRYFEDVTGTRLLACVIPAPNPLARGLMAAHGLDSSRFAERLRELARHATIGYHGHYFHVAADGLPTPMRHADFDRARFARQFDEETDWLASIGFPPTFYTGGWWVLNRSIVEALDAVGIRYDFSLRPSLCNTFGEQYDLPVIDWTGRPRLLGRHVWELGSFTGLWRYPADSSAWRSARPPASGLRFFGLYFHDYDVLSYAVALRRMIRWLSRLPSLAWVAFDDLTGAGLP